MPCWRGCSPCPARAPQSGIDRHALRRRLRRRAPSAGTRSRCCRRGRRSARRPRRRSSRQLEVEVVRDRAHHRVALAHDARARPRGRGRRAASGSAAGPSSGVRNVGQVVDAKVGEPHLASPRDSAADRTRRPSPAGRAEHEHPHRGHLQCRAGRSGKCNRGRRRGSGRVARARSSHQHDRMTPPFSAASGRHRLAHAT